MEAAVTAENEAEAAYSRLEAAHAANAERLERAQKALEELECEPEQRGEVVGEKRQRPE